MINTKTFLAQARNVQFDVVRFLVCSEANQFQIPKSADKY